MACSSITNKWGTYIVKGIPFLNGVSPEDTPFRTRKFRVPPLIDRGYNRFGYLVLRARPSAIGRHFLTSLWPCNHSGMGNRSDAVAYSKREVSRSLLRLIYRSAFST